MGVSTEDVFGDASGAQPATPGSYGEAPAGFRLPDAARLGGVRLQIADLGRSVAYYEGTLGLRVLHRDRQGAVLAAQDADVPLVELREHPGARPAPHRGRLGLYHFAILLPDRPSLGRFVRHLEEIGARAASADHLVSEALYLQDPDNLGIEVYADRPRATWQRIGRELMMAVDPLDFGGLLEAAGDARWAGMPPGTTMGHVHLHVGDIETASSFFSGALGFDRMVWHYPGALFLAFGGYHHRLGTNTWAGPGARSASPDDAQLLEWTIDVPGEATLEAAAESLTQAGHHVAWGADHSPRRALILRNPWGMAIRLRLILGLDLD